MFLGDKMKIFAGPCGIESKDHALYMSQEIGKIMKNRGMDFVFKASFEKANRWSSDSFSGHGIEYGEEAVALIKKEIGYEIVTDVHETW
jgi:2-dehydro-3-deoxyphosphooctonate aldolase (KDO 8-P synthase)